MVGKDKVVLNCILFKSDVGILKDISKEYNISFSCVLRDIVKEYCNRIRYFREIEENLDE